MAQAEEWLALVEGWRRKSGEYFYQSNDGLHSSMLKGFDSVALILSPNSNHSRILRALGSLDYERKMSMEDEDPNADPIRVMTFGFIESVHLALRHYEEKTHSLQALVDSLQAQINMNIPKETAEQCSQTDEISMELLIEDTIKLEEMFNENLEDPMNRENVNEVVEFPHPAANSVDALSTVPRFTKPFPKEIKQEVVPKKEPIDITETIPEDNQVSAMDNTGDIMDFMDEGMPNDDVGFQMDDMANVTSMEQMISANEEVNGRIEKEEEKDKSIDEDALMLIHKTPILYKFSSEDERKLQTPQILGMSGDSPNQDNEGDEEEPIDGPKDSSENIAKRRRSTRIETKSQKYSEFLEDSDSHSEPAEKKSKSDKMNDNMRSSRDIENKSVSAKKDRVIKLNDTDLECPECEYRSRNVNTWVEHLRRIHSTNLSLSGLALRCDCGNESLSAEHARKCIANCSVIRKKDGPIRRLSDEKKTPQCVLCVLFPKTPSGYVHHLHRNHKSTLLSNGIYLVCACGLEVRSSKDAKHQQECDHREFTLHKLNEK